MTITLKGNAHDADPLLIDFTVARQSGYRHTIQFTLHDASGDVAAPAAGTLTIKARAPGARSFEAITDGTVDVTSRDNWTQLLTMHVEALEVTPGSVTSGYTWDVSVSSTF